MITTLSLLFIAAMIYFLRSLLDEYKVSYLMGNNDNNFSLFINIR